MLVVTPSSIVEKAVVPGIMAENVTVSEPPQNAFYKLFIMNIETAFRWRKAVF
jgi:hypothetical protein